MVRPEPIIGCPNGLEYLKDLDQFHIEQIAKLPEGNFCYFLLN